MFDGFKATIYDKLTYERLLKNPPFDLIEHTSRSTGEINYSGEFKGLKVQIFTSGRIQIAGSLHKSHNDGQHNWNDFSVSNLKDVLNNLRSDLNLNPLKASINNLEFGVNVFTPFCPNSLINDLLCFKWEQFNRMGIKGQGQGKECKAFKQYYVKIYNKGLQYDQPQRILRVEKKIVTMVALKFGLLNLSDLLNPYLWQHCKAELINMVDEILINEPIKIDLLTKNEKRIYEIVINQRNWVGLGRDKKSKYKKRFNEIIANYGQQQYRPVIMGLINEKFDQLINS
jgi:hypothetical protein